MAALATHTITHTPTGWKHIKKLKHGWALNTFIQPEPVSHATINRHMDSQQWINAMNEEWNALVANGTFEPVDRSELPPGKHPLCCTNTSTMHVARLSDTRHDW